jgi:hypothetical protein
MKRFVISLVFILLLTGCGALDSAQQAAGPATLLPSPTVVLSPLEQLTFKTTAFALGAWPDMGGPYVRMSPHDGDRDASGIRVYVANGKAYDDPVVQAQDGLFALVRYSANKQAVDLALALQEAQHLLSYHTTNAATGDAWWYPYPFDFSEYSDSQETAIAPWYSGMAQGEALDLFTRLYTRTGDQQWATAAAHTFTSFLYPLKAGESLTARPWSVQVESNGYLWIEEYPTPNAQDDTINGFGFALFGLIEYARLTKDARAVDLADAGLTTYLYGATKVRNPGGISSYSVSHPEAKHSGYHIVVTRQLALFAAVTKDARFDTLAKEFFKDYHTT